MTPADVRRMARSWIKDVRAGVIARKDKFDEKWFKDFVRTEFAGGKHGE